MDKDEKKIWKGPQLTIIFRDPAENVLTSCKSGIPEEPAALQKCVYWASTCPLPNLGCVDVTGADPTYPWAHVPCSGPHGYEVCPSRAITPS